MHVDLSLASARYLKRPQPSVQNRTFAKWPAGGSRQDHRVFYNSWGSHINSRDGMTKPLNGVRGYFTLHSHSLSLTSRPQSLPSVLKFVMLCPSERTSHAHTSLTISPDVLFPLSSTVHQPNITSCVMATSLLGSF